MSIRSPHNIVIPDVCVFSKKRAIQPCAAEVEAVYRQRCTGSGAASVTALGAGATRLSAGPCSSAGGHCSSCNTSLKI